MASFFDESRDVINRLFSKWNTMHFCWGILEFFYTYSSDKELYGRRFSRLILIWDCGQIEWSKWELYRISPIRDSCWHMLVQMVRFNNWNLSIFMDVKRQYQLPIMSHNSKNLIFRCNFVEFLKTCKLSFSQII